MTIGRYIKQPSGYQAFIPDNFPPEAGFNLSDKLIRKATDATLAVGRLDGITYLLPDVDFFLFMYICKDAASSSQIEGTRATMVDALEAQAEVTRDLPDDVDDITHYIHALNYGLERLQDFPMSLRLIKEVHKELMQGARATQRTTPGEFRSSQNWIGGASLNEAHFVPPPSNDLLQLLGKLEHFIHDDVALPHLIKAGLIHAQFETIHPFLDGNGRVGRILITLYLWLNNMLKRPVLFLSSYFKRHQTVYYNKLDAYHEGYVESWLDFFLDGVIKTAEEALETAQAITKLREKDLHKIQKLNKTASESAVKILPELFKLPIVNAKKIEAWTGYSRRGALKVINRFVELGILEQKDEYETYDKLFIYRRYVDIFK